MGEMACECVSIHTTLTADLAFLTLDNRTCDMIKALLSLQQTDSTDVGCCPTCPGGLALALSIIQMLSPARQPQVVAKAAIMVTRAILNLPPSSHLASIYTPLVGRSVLASSFRSLILTPYLPSPLSLPDVGIVFRKTLKLAGTQIFKFVLEDLKERLELPYDVDSQAAALLETQLGIGATAGTQPDFTHPGALAGYTLTHIRSRPRRLASLLFHPQIGKFTPRDAWSWLTPALERILHNPERNHIGLLSLGGGPGYDYAGVKALCAVTNPCVAVTGHILDYEPAWSPLVDAVAEAVGSAPHLVTKDDRVIPGTCDITLPLESEPNAPVLSALDTSALSLVVASFVVEENRLALRQSDYIFFRQLLQALSQQDSQVLFVITETTERQWPDFVRIVQEELGPSTPFAMPSAPHTPGLELVFLLGGGEDYIYAPTPSDLSLLEEFSKRAANVD